MQNKIFEKQKLQSKKQSKVFQEQKLKSNKQNKIFEKQKIKHRKKSKSFIKRRWTSVIYPKSLSQSSEMQHVIKMNSFVSLSHRISI